MAKYVVEKDTDGCKECGVGALWTIVRPDGVADSTSWEDKEFADELCDKLNDAYERGLRDGKQ